MSVVAMKCAAWKMMIWFAGRLEAPMRCPVPLSGLRGHGESLLQSPYGGAIVGLAAAVAFVLSVRSNWRDICGRSYSR